MTITVNNEKETFDTDHISESQLLLAKRYSFPLIIIRIEGRLIDRSHYDTEIIRDGYKVDLYHMISGG